MLVKFQPIEIKKIILFKMATLKKVKDFCLWLYVPFHVHDKN